MKISKKALALVVAMTLAIGCVTGGVLAWLTAQTESVVNTFTAAKLIDDPKTDFVLKEHKVVRDGTTGTHVFDEAMTEVNAVTYERVVPGENLPKDPFVRVKNAENAYLFIEVKNELANGMTYTMDPSWKELMIDGQQATGKNGGLVFVKKVDAVDAKNEYVLPARDAAETFKILNPEKIVVDATFDPAAVNNDGSVKLSFWAYLAQADGFENYTAAWNATFGATM